MKQRQDNMRKDMPASHCLPWPVPAVAAVPVPFQILQTRSSIVILHEVQTMWRQIYLDGRVLSEKPNPTWLGYSKGHWEGDTLVVDTRGFNDRSWLGRRRSSPRGYLHVIERFRRLDFGHMEIEFTIDDPKTYSKAWTNKMPVLNLCRPIPSSTKTCARRMRKTLTLSWQVRELCITPTVRVARHR